MKLYASDIEKSYKDTIIGHFENLGTEYLLLHNIPPFSLILWYEAKTIYLS